MKTLPAQYRSQSKARMVGPLFEEYHLWFDREFAKNEPSRQGLLFMDNASVHKYD